MLLPESHLDSPTHTSAPALDVQKVLLRTAFSSGLTLEASSKERSIADERFEDVLRTTQICHSQGLTSNTRCSGVLRVPPGFPEKWELSALDLHPYGTL